MKRRTLSALAVVLAATGLVTAPRADAVGPPMVTILDAIAVEGQNDPFFVVVNSGDNPVTVTWHTGDGAVPPRINMTAPLPEAEHGKDYPRRSNQQLQIPGNASVAIEIPVTVEAGDDDDAPVEYFHVTIETPTGVDRLTMTANAAIFDDDARSSVPPVPGVEPPTGLPQVSIADASRPEGDRGNPVLRFKATLSQALPVNLTVSYRTVEGSATPGRDYVSSTGPLTFRAGEEHAWVSIPLRGDTTREDHERFEVKLSTWGYTNVLFSDHRATGTIANDDPVPTMRVTDVQVREGGRAVFKILLSNASETPVSVDFGTRGHSARARRDYSPVSGRRTFSPGDLVEIVSVRVDEDRRAERRERFALRLSDPRGARIADSVGWARIADDD